MKKQAKKQAKMQAKKRVTRSQIKKAIREVKQERKSGTAAQDSLEKSFFKRMPNASQVKIPQSIEEYNLFAQSISRELQQTPLPKRQELDRCFIERLPKSHT